MKKAQRHLEKADLNSKQSISLDAGRMRMFIIRKTEKHDFKLTLFKEFLNI